MTESVTLDSASPGGLSSSLAAHGVGSTANCKGKHETPRAGVSFACDIVRQLYLFTLFFFSPAVRLRAVVGCRLSAFFMSSGAELVLAAAEGRRGR